MRRRGRLYTLREWLLWNGYGWVGCVNWQHNLTWRSA